LIADFAEEFDIMVGMETVMRGFRILCGLFLLSAVLAPLPARACPMCSEFVSSATEAEETDNFPAAVNKTIYFMLGVPYTALMVFGFLIWRGLVKNEAYRQALREREEQTNRPQDEPEASGPDA
jgi:hypothetical protein